MTSSAEGCFRAVEPDTLTVDFGSEAALAVGSPGVR